MHYPTWTGAVYHDGSALYLQPSQPYQLGQQVTVRLRTPLDAPITQAFIRICPDGEQTFVAMQPAERSETAQWWQGQITLSMPRTGYRFWLMTEQGGWWLSAAGIQRSTPTDASDFKLLADYHAPTWVHSAVFYQIFPDRFCDGEPSNNVVDGEYQVYGVPTIARQWGEAPQKATGGVEFFGGDLQGIRQKLEYLDQLGINALYLTPIFTAPSNHKYDTADYLQIDQHFGGEAALAELRQASQRYQMKLMLDIVLNHCGYTHHWFTAAQADAHAPTADYFSWTAHPNEYESWLGHRSLPKLNYTSQGLRQAIYGSEQAIIRHWLRQPYAIDGWRIDVANMLARQGPSQLGHKIGRALRSAVKAEAPEAYLLGEHFYDGSNHLQGDELDASMNYRGFTFPTLQWLVGFDMASVWNLAWEDRALLPSQALGEQWLAFLAVIPWQIALQQFNLLDSHDTPRLLTIVGGNRALHQVAVTLQMTFPGVPCIYYGDEVGMQGGGDPYCRGCMPWDAQAWDHELLAFYRALIGLRRSSSALSVGGFQLLLAEGDTVAFMRRSADECLLIVAQRAATSIPPIPMLAAGLADGTIFVHGDDATEIAIQSGALNIPQTGIGASIWRMQG